MVSNTSIVKRPAAIIFYNQFVIEQRRSYGAPRFKPRTMKNKPLRTPSMLALDHFDFYYKPLYGNMWPSIRLGLLTPNKFIAVVNRFSQSLEFNKDILHKIGAFDLTDKLTHGSQDNLPPETERRQHKVEQQLQQYLTESFGSDQSIKSFVERQRDEFDEQDIGLRSEAGLKHYRESFHVFDQKDLEKYRTEEQKCIVRDNEFEITGVESLNLDAELLPSFSDFIVYPRQLQLFVHSKNSIDGFPRPVLDKMKISSWWLLDGASVLPVLALNLDKSDVVLDMCAAPGGKSLLIAQTDNFSTLVSNDVKQHRIGQLHRGLQMFIPSKTDVSDRIILKRKDASTMEGWDELDTYDKVLVDAPCTTDRLSANTDEGNIFATPNTQERLDLPKLQTRMLVNALRSVRVGGCVVYSTCSLSPSQNEAVVENAVVLANRYYNIRCVERSLKSMEAHLQSTGLFRFYSLCQRGILVLPWILSNFGPMYICKLQRLK